MEIEIEKGIMAFLFWIRPPCRYSRLTGTVEVITVTIHRDDYSVFSR